jgi:hypothetical protein
MPTWTIISCILFSFVAGWVSGALREQVFWRALREKDFEQFRRARD